MKIGSIAQEQESLKGDRLNPLLWGLLSGLLSGEKFNDLLKLYRFIQVY